MEVDCNLKKLANFFKILLCILEKSITFDYNLLLCGEFTHCFPPGALIKSNQFTVEKRFFVKYLISTVLTNIKHNLRFSAPFKLHWTATKMLWINCVPPIYLLHLSRA